MAESRAIDSGLGTKEEDWPGIDVDSDIEEGAEAIRRAEAAMHATVERSIKQRRAHCSHEDNIPREVYVKAQKHQDQLTHEERNLLLSRGDVVGKALAHPDSLSDEEVHQILNWAPPDKARANIQRATGGRLSTPRELHAKAKSALDRGNFEAEVNDEEMSLLSRAFYTRDDPAFNPGATMAAFGGNGPPQAMALLTERLGVSLKVVSICLLLATRATMPDIPGLPSLPPLPPVSQLREPPPRPPPSQTDLLGYGPWPPGVEPRYPIAIFHDNAGIGGMDPEPWWSIQPEKAKDICRAQSETLRREAWAKHGKPLSEEETNILDLAGREDGGQPQMHPKNPVGVAPHSGGEAVPELPPMPTVTAFQLFCNEEGSGVGPEEMERRWEALGSLHRYQYELKTAEVNNKIRLAYQRHQSDMSFWNHS